MWNWLHRELNWGLFFNNICDFVFLKTLPYTNWVQHGQAEDSQQSRISLIRNYASTEAIVTAWEDIFCSKQKQGHPTWMLEPMVELQKLFSAPICEIVYPLRQTVMYE